MPGPGGILTIDAASRLTGWAYDTVDGRDPSYGAWVLPGIADLGDLWTRFRNTLEDAVTVHRPRRIVFAIPLMKGHANSRALIGMSVMIEVVCQDEAVLCNEVAETTARKEILGRGSFMVYRDGKPIKGTGTERAKIAAMEWCGGRGWRPQTHDVADALVILEYAKRWDLAQKQWNQAA